MVSQLMRHFLFCTGKRPIRARETTGGWSTQLVFLFLSLIENSWVRRAFLVSCIQGLLHSDFFPVIHDP